MDLVNDSSKFGWLDEERLLILLMNVDHQASRSRGQGYPLSLLGCSILLSAQRHTLSARAAFQLVALPLGSLDSHARDDVLQQRYDECLAATTDIRSGFFNIACRSNFYDGTGRWPDSSEEFFASHSGLYQRTKRIDDRRMLRIQRRIARAERRLLVVGSSLTLTSPGVRFHIAPLAPSTMKPMIPPIRMLPRNRPLISLLKAMNLSA